jgi:hypothetical protein
VAKVMLQPERRQRAKAIGHDHRVIAGLQAEIRVRVDVGRALAAEGSQGAGIGPIVT